MKRPEGPTGNETPSPAVNEQIGVFKNALPNKCGRPGWANDG